MRSLGGRADNVSCFPSCKSAQEKSQGGRLYLVCEDARVSKPLLHFLASQLSLSDSRNKMIVSFLSWLLLSMQKVAGREGTQESLLQS